MKYVQFRKFLSSWSAERHLPSEKRICYLILVIIENRTSKAKRVIARIPTMVSSLYNFSNMDKIWGWRCKIYVYLF